MSSTYGEHLRFTLWGQSHSPAIGVTIEGIPSGQPIDLQALQSFLSRRAPGNSSLSTARKETDIPQFLSGLVNGKTCGSPVTVLIPNTNARPQDYVSLSTIPRPSHADYPARVKYADACDLSGGGHFSGRLTAGLCVVGGICKQLLATQGIVIGAHIQSIGPIYDLPFDPVQIDQEILLNLNGMSFPLLNSAVGPTMEQSILETKANGDSLGGIIECAATGVPAGWGDPIFAGMENRISQVVFGIPGVRGIEFGTGFAAASLFGSQHNDSYYVDSGTIKTKTNHHGGVLGGVTTGMPLVFRVAIKPTASIALPQESVVWSADGTVCPTTLTISGRHDPCIVPRALPCVEAAAAVALYDAYLHRKTEVD